MSIQPSSENESSTKWNIVQASSIREHLAIPRNAFDSLFSSRQNSNFFTADFECDDTLDERKKNIVSESLIIEVWKLAGLAP